MTTAQEIGEYAPHETRRTVAAFDNALVDGVTLTGTPTVNEQTTSDLTIADVALNSAAVTVYRDGVAVSVAANLAVVFSITGGTAGKPYTVRVTATTTGTPAETLSMDCEFIPSD